MEQSAAGRIIVLTGCTRGLGRALTEYFAEHGATVIGCGRSRPGIKALESALGDAHHFSVVDISRDEEVHAWAQDTLAAFDAPDLLVNNAAIIGQNAPLWEVPAREFNQVLAVNVNGTANVLRHFVPAMIARGRGVVVNFSSGWGRSTAAEVAPYCASKWAIEGLTRALAQELPRGLAAVALNPGIIDTQMLQTCFGGGSAHYPPPATWVQQAGPYLLQLSARDNGKALTVPDVPT